MIKLGSNRVALYPNNGICFENRGVIVFQGNCTIGMNSFISIAPSGKVVFGDGFVASNSLKLASYCNIEFGKNVSVGWECLFTDTDFHRITMLDGSKSPTAYGQILIGDNCWFGFKNIIMKNTRIPNKCIISANSLVNKNYDVPECSLLAGQPAKLRKTGMWRNLEDDIISYDNQ